MINLTAAQIELDNFKRHVIPVAEFFDTKQILHLVNISSKGFFYAVIPSSLVKVTGDRGPEDVYVDFRLSLHNIADKLQQSCNDQENKETDSALDLNNRKVVWIVGGPGSKKFARVKSAMRNHKDWYVLSTGQMFRDYLDKINADSEKHEEDDSSNNNIITENKQITKTLTEMLEKGNLVPHVSLINAEDIFRGINPVHI